MSEYHKINNVYRRGIDGKLIMGEYSKPEFEALRDAHWLVTEKVDGMNIRVIYDTQNGVSFRGRTDNAVLPKPLLKHLEETFTVEKMCHLFSSGCILYGEGFGPKIQKVGHLYGGEQRFILFDARIDGWHGWLHRCNVEDIAERLEIPVAPSLGRMTLDKAIKLVKGGLKSGLGDLEAEGVIVRLYEDVYNCFGERVITKIKHKDFRSQ